MIYEGQLNDKEHKALVDNDLEVEAILEEVYTKEKELVDSWKDRTSKDQKRYEAKALKEKKAKYAKHPDLMIVWNPGMETGLMYSIDKWDDAEVCCNCGKVGCYRLAGDKNAPGVCREDIEQHKDETDISKKDILKVIELAFGHGHADAMSREEYSDSR